MANKKQQQQKQEVRQAAQAAASNGKINIKEYNQILKIAGDATAAAKAIANTGATIKPIAQQAINQSIVPTYNPATYGGAGLGMKDVNYLTSLGVDKAGVKQAAAAAPYVSTGVYNNYRTGQTGEMLAIQDWIDSVNTSNQTIIDAINTQVTTNQADNSQWLDEINSMSATIGALQQQMAQMQGPQGAYAVVTSQNAPAAGAKTTSEIAPRRKPVRNPLSISPAMGSSAGAGLNIAA
jgi:hypothetical protein